MAKNEITVSVNTSQLDLAIEKATRLIELLKEAQTIIESLKPLEVLK